MSHTTFIYQPPSLHSLDINDALGVCSTGSAAGGSASLKQCNAGDNPNVLALPPACSTGINNQANWAAFCQVGTEVSNSLSSCNAGNNPAS